MVTNVIDEVCPEVDASEAARYKVIEKVLIHPMGNHKMAKDIIESVIRERFKQIGVEVLSIETRRTFFGEYKCSIEETSPVNLNLIWGRRLGIPD